MKKVIQAISLVVACLSFVLLLYGSIKLARVEAATVPQSLKSGIPGVEIVQSSNVTSRKNAQIIMGFSLATLIIGSAVFFISSPKASGKTN